MHDMLRLTIINELGISESFLTQISHMGMELEWILFKTRYIRSDSSPTQSFMQSIALHFCHIHAIPIFAEDTFWIAKIPKLHGYIARFSELKMVLDELDLEKDWDKFSLGSTYCLLNDDKESSPSNWAIYWVDVDRFFRKHDIVCKPLLDNKFPAKEFLLNVAANVSLSGLEVTDEMARLASLAANGIITTREAFEKLSIKAGASRVLFVCTSNIQRSLTAEHLFTSLYPQVEFRSAGVSKKECTRNNSTLCTEQLLAWAGSIFVFEQMHIDRISENTDGSALQKIVNLEIDDIYQYNDLELIELLKKKLKGRFS
jgi:predicted protein tyrosine phosphatase